MSIGSIKSKSSYTLSGATNDKIEQLAEDWGLSKTRVIETLVSIAPRDKPGKRVAVLSLFPIICTTDGWEWDEKYTGPLYIEFPTGQPFQQMILYVEPMTFEDLTHWLSSRYQEMKRFLPLEK